MPTRKHYTVIEVSELFRRKPDTIRHWLRTGKLTAIRTPGGGQLISAEQVEAFLGEVQPGQCESQSALDRRLGKLADQLQTQ